MQQPNATDDILSRAATEHEAVELLVAAGRPRADAQEVAAIAFGSSGGDVVGRDRRGWASTQAQAQILKGRS